MNDLNEGDLPIPTLMRMARGAYSHAISAELLALDYDDLPRNAVVVLTAIDDSEGARPELPAELGVTKQAVSLVIDTLVKRGYLERRPDTNDRRRINLQLSDRGHEVVHTAARAVAAIDRQLEARLSHEQIVAARATLMVLSEIKAVGIAESSGSQRAPRQLRQFSPIFPVRNLAEALLHYRSLGFNAFAYDNGDEYAFANRDGVGLHLTTESGPETWMPGNAYLYVRDADALYEEWNRPGVAGHTRPVTATPYKLREGSHVDPDGNRIRFGSPIEETPTTADINHENGD